MALTAVFFRVEHFQDYRESLLGDYRVFAPFFRKMMMAPFTPLRGAAGRNRKPQPLRVHKPESILTHPALLRSSVVRIIRVWAWMADTVCMRKEWS